MTAVAVWRRMAAAVARAQPRLATLDEHAAQACAVLDVDRLVLAGDELVERLVELLTPVYWQDNPELAHDTVLLGFVSEDAQFVARRLDELGLQLIRRADR